VPVPPVTCSKCIKEGLASPRSHTSPAPPLAHVEEGPDLCGPPNSPRHRPEASEMLGRNGAADVEKTDMEHRREKHRVAVEKQLERNDRIEAVAEVSLQPGRSPSTRCRTLTVTEKQPKRRQTPTEGAAAKGPHRSNRRGAP